MSNETKKPTKIMISSIILGICGGVLLAAILLGIYNQLNYLFDSSIFWILCLLTAAFPLCFWPFAKKGLSLFWILLLCLFVSYLLTVSYANSIASNEQTIARLLKEFSILHGTGLLVDGIVYWFLIKKKGQ